MFFSLSIVTLGACSSDDDALPSNSATVDAGDGGGSGTLLPGFELVSVTTGGEIANNNSSAPSLSDDGQVVAFMSVASNLHPEADGTTTHVYVRDRKAGTTELVSRTKAGQPADNNSGSPVVSGNGRFIAFASYATNLVDDDTNGDWDVFVYDRSDKTVTRVSVNSAGEEGDGDSDTPAISDDGQHVAFSSLATELVDGDTNGTKDVFVRDLEAGRTQRVSVTSAGEQSAHDSGNPALSDDGRYVAFDAFGDDLVEGDNSATGKTDVFRHDIDTGETIRVSVLGEENQQFAEVPSINGDGRFIAFDTRASFVSGDANEGMVDAYRWDATGPTFTLASRDSAGQSALDGDGMDPLIDDSGSRVLFWSDSPSLVAGDTNAGADIFLFDASTETVIRLTGSAEGPELAQPLFGHAISGSGSTIALSTEGDNLVEGDDNMSLDVFVKDL